MSNVKMLKIELTPAQISLFEDSETLAVGIEGLSNLSGENKITLIHSWEQIEFQKNSYLVLEKHAVEMLKREKEILFQFDWCGEYLEGLVKLVEES